MRRLPALLSMLALPVAARAEPAAPGGSSSAALYEAPAGHDGQVGAVGRAEVDVASGNVGPAFGLALGLASRLELDLLVVTESANGFRAAWAFFFRPDRAFKPLLRAGTTIIGHDGTRLGVHGGLGAVWDVASMLGIVADGAVEHFFDMPDGVDANALRFSAGLELRTPR